MRRKFKVLKARGGKDASRDDFNTGPTNSGSTGDDAKLNYLSGDYQKINLTRDQKNTLNKQRKKTTQAISPSTSLSGQALRYGLMFSGVPFSKTITEKALDTGASMGYGKTKTKTTTSNKNIGTKGPPKFTDNGGGFSKKITSSQPIQATKPIDQSLINPKDNFFNFVAYNVGGLSGGVSYGPPPKRGPNPQVPPVKMKRGGYKK